MNKIDNFKKPHLNPFNCVQTNGLYQIELLVLDNNTWNRLTVCKQMQSNNLLK